MISSFNENVATYVSAKDFKYSGLSKYNMIIVGEIHYTGMGNVYRQLLSKYKFDYLIAEFADMDRSYTREELKEKMNNCTHGSYDYDPSRPCDDQYNYWIYKIAYDFNIPLIGCNFVTNKKFKNMNDEDNVREQYMLSTIKEFESKGKCLVQLGDHHLRSIPITKEFLEYCNDTTDDRGIYKNINDLTVDHSSPIWEEYKDRSNTLILRVKDEYNNEINFMKNIIEGKYNLQSDRYDPIMGINEIPLLESQDKSVLDKNFKKKTGIEFYLVNTESKVFKDSFPEKLPKRKYENYGIGALVKGTNEYAGSVEIAPKWILEEKWHGNLLYSLYIVKKFRGYGLSNIIVKEAISKYDANMLWVDTDNEVAINLYKKFGFKIVDRMKDKDNEDAYIMVRSTARQSKNESTLIEQSIQKNKITINKIKSIVSKIYQKAKSDEKPPTGNQNCMLCTWCVEAQIRGLDILPRPVYSPRDIIFKQKGYDIIKSPSKEKINNITQLKSILLKDDNSRYYVHVNWKNKTSGHEFIITNIDKEIYVIDGQAGLVEPIDTKSGKYYFKDINYSNSYIVRMDNKDLNDDILKYNDMKYLIYWDEEKDIEYMNSDEYNNLEEFALLESARENKIYYGLTEKEAKQKHLVYKKNGNYTHKGLNTTLSGLKKFVIDNNMQKIITKYTILDRNIFDIDENVYPDKEYDMIAAKLPFEFDITNVHDLNVVPAKRGVKNESMAGTIGSAIVPSIPSITPYEANPKNYYIVQHMKNNVFNYGITSDPVQYSIYSIDPEEGYKVYKTNKKDFKNSYITFKMKDKRKAKEVYNEVVRLYESGDSMESIDAIYNKYTNKHLLDEYQLLFDPTLELVRDFDSQIQYESDKLYDYLMGNDISLLEIESDNLEDGMYSILDPDTIHDLNDLEKWKVSFDGLHHDLKMRSNDMSRERYGFDNIERYNMIKARMLSDEPPVDNLVTLYVEDAIPSEHFPAFELYDWKEKLSYLRIMEKDGYIFLLDTGSSRYIDEYTEENIDTVQKKYEEYLMLPENKRVLYDTTLNNIIGIGNYDIYKKILIYYNEKINVVSNSPDDLDTDDTAPSDRREDLPVDIIGNPETVHVIKNEMDVMTLSNVLLNGSYEDKYNLYNILQERMNMEDGSGELLRPVFVIIMYSESAVVKIFEKAMPDQKYWHAAIGFGPLLDTLYSFNMDHHANKLKGGLSFESLKAYIRDNPKSTCQINCVFLKEGKYNQLKKTLNFYIFNKNRTRYDTINLLMSLFEKGKRNGLNLNQVCSSFVDTLLQSININISGKEYSNTTKPDDLRSDTKENKKYFKIYEGLITKYQPSKIVKIVEKMARDPKNNYFGR